VWLRKHLADTVPAFRRASTRTEAELTVNQTEGRDINDFTSGLSRMFVAFTQALKPGGPFVFTYHHNDIEAYLPIAVALLDASLVCTATPPCPAEMSASIHINGTRSSKMDSIFVCRTTGKVRASHFGTTLEDLKRMLQVDLEDLQQAGIAPAAGDARCLILGHLTRLAVWKLRPVWRDDVAVTDKLAVVRDTLQEIYPLDLLDRLVFEVISSLSDVDLLATMRVREKRADYGDDQISF
jgi:putative DNA methylase